MRRRILGMIGAAGLFAGSALLSLGGAASAAATPASVPSDCAPGPGVIYSSLAQSGTNPAQDWMTYLHMSPGQYVATHCAPGRQ